MSEGTHSFHEYLKSNNILCGVRDLPGREVLIKLLSLLKRHFPELDIDDATAEVLKREEIMPTVIAPGLAMPHARLEGLSEPLVAMACCPEGVDFSSGAKVRLMVLMLTPIDDPNLHMQLMAAFASEFGKRGGDVGEVAVLRSGTDVTNWFAGGKFLMPEYLTAGDVMHENPAVLHETDTFREAIRMFATNRAVEFPVIDKAGDLRGVVSLGDLLKFCLPEHLLWMEDLSPIYRFQPFADMLKTSGDTRVADIMREEFISVDEKVPAIQLAKLFLVHKVPQLIITDSSGHLAGVVEIKEFTTRLFWE